MRQVFEHIRTVEDIAPLTEAAFKTFVADVFRDAGFEVEAPSEPRDYGADFIMTKVGRRAVVRLWSIDIPEGVETIRTQTFFNCRMLSRVTLPDGLRAIERRAFGQCRMLARIALPSSVEEVAPLAFEGCERLTDVAVVGEGCRCTFYRSAFASCPVMDKPAPIDDLHSTATLMNDTVFAQMFEGPSYELRALKFEKYDFERTPGCLTGFSIVDRGVGGLNHFSGDSVDGGNAEFWVALNKGCDEGYYVVKGTTASEPDVLFKLRRSACLSRSSPRTRCRSSGKPATHSKPA